MAGKLQRWQAAEILGVSDRTMRRWRWRYQRHGYDALYDRRKGKPSPKRVPLQTVEKVLRLYRLEYADHNMRHFHQKLVQEHGIELSYSWSKRPCRALRWWPKPRRERLTDNDAPGGLWRE